MEFIVQSSMNHGASYLGMRKKCNKQWRIPITILVFCRIKKKEPSKGPELTQPPFSSRDPASLLSSIFVLVITNKLLCSKYLHDVLVFQLFSGDP
jgi:hypothetical protein